MAKNNKSLHKEHINYYKTLEAIRRSGVCNMWGAAGYNDKYNPILIQPNSWVGLLANDEDCDWIETIRNNQIYVVTNDDEIGYYPTGCSMTQWNDDCEEITNEVERILNEYNLYDHDRNMNVANLNQLVTVLEILKNIK